MHGYRSDCKNTQISNLSWGMESMDPELFKTVPGMSLRPLDRFLEFDEKIFWRSKIAKITIFTKIDRTSKICKKWLRGRSGIPGTVLERLGSIFFENKNCINKIIIFHAFWEPKRYYSFASGSKIIIQFGLWKAWKMMVLLMQFLFSKSMDLQLSKTVPIIPLRPLVMILWFLEVPQKC